MTAADQSPTSNQPTLCVAIGSKTVAEMAAEHQSLVAAGVSLVEFRLDKLTDASDISILFKNKPSPVIATCRKTADGGSYSGDETARRELLQTAIDAGAEYVDIEHDIATEFSRSGKSKRVISIHNFNETPENLKSLLADLASLDADVVKIAAKANSVSDNLRMLQLTRDTDIPTVGLCMGELGIPSRILSGKFGSVWTYASYTEEELAPGLLSYKQLMEMYRYEETHADTEVYAVIGDPIKHSQSPLIHNASFIALDLPHLYIPLKIPPEDLDTFLKAAPSYGIKGISVTIPHKENILKTITNLDPLAVEVAAANTMVYEADGSISGYNTDLLAAIESIELGLDPTYDGESGSPLAGKCGIILGAGGAAKAIACGLKQRGAKVLITNRTHDRAQELADRLNCETIAWEDRGKAEAEVIINCTPIGMHPEVDASPMEAEWLETTKLVFDTVYNPEKTLLLQQAKQVGKPIVTGIEMFVRQAAVQFKLFTNQDAPLDVMRNHLRDAL